MDKLFVQHVPGNKSTYIFKNQWIGHFFVLRTHFHHRKLKISGQTISPKNRFCSQRYGFNDSYDIDLTLYILERNVRFYGGARYGRGGAGRLQSKLVIRSPDRFYGGSRFGKRTVQATDAGKLN